MAQDMMAINIKRQGTLPLQKRGPVVPVHFSHEPLNDKNLSGYGQAISALALGLGKINVPAIVVFPYHQYWGASCLGMSTSILEMDISFPPNGHKRNVNVFASNRMGGGVDLTVVGPSNDYFSFDSYSSQGLRSANNLMPNSGSLYSAGPLTEQALVYNLALVGIAQFLTRDANLSGQLVFQGHDHLTALALSLLANQRLCRTILTIHNPAYSSLLENQILGQLGFNNLDPRIGEKDYTDLLALAMQKSSMVTTVSPRYAYEIGESSFSFGPKNLSYGTILSQRQSSIIGINNALSPDFLVRDIPFLYDGKKSAQMVLSHRLEEAQKRWSAFIGGAMQGLSMLNPTLVVDIVASGDPKIAKNLQSVIENVRRIIKLNWNDPTLLFFEEYNEGAYKSALQSGHISATWSKFEPFGLAALTAMANGLLTLVNPVGGLRNIIGFGEYYASWSSLRLIELGEILRPFGLGVTPWGIYFNQFNQRDPIDHISLWSAFAHIVNVFGHPGIEEIRRNGMARARENFSPEKIAQEYVRQVYIPLIAA